MSISYQPKDSAVQAQQLKVQELVLTLADKQLVSVAGTDVTIDVAQPISSVLTAIHCDDSLAASQPTSAAVLLVAQADIDLSVANKITLTLANALAAEDSIIVKYIAS
jgi:hypothetical protein